MGTVDAAASTASSQTDVELIIDNPDAVLTGTWRTSTFQLNYYGSNYIFVPLPSSATARWYPQLPASGRYTVSLWLPDGNTDRSKAVVYHVRHAGEDTTFTVDQTRQGGYWSLLGDVALDFDASGDEYVELRVNEAALAGYVQADAVRFATPLPQPKDKPAGVTTITDRNYVELTWGAVDNATNYVISRAVGAGTYSQIAVARDSTGYLDLDVQPGTYRYTVTGRNASGVGPVSDPARADVPAGAPLQAVQGLRATTDAGGGTRLEWAPVPAAEGYLIQRATRSGGPYRTIATVQNSGFVDKGLRGHFFYVVRAINRFGAAELSSWQVNVIR